MHPYLDAHYVCAEHGEVVESGHDGKPSATAQVRAADQDAHDHCSLHGVPVAAVSHLVLALPPEPSPVVRDLLLPGAGGPRAPPLAYAPKTSPPALL